MLSVEHLTKRFGDLLALDDVSFEVEPGQILGFLGPNGAGKTTTMRSIMRLVTLVSGDVRWRGVSVDADVRRRFGYMPAERGMYKGMAVREHLVYYGRLSGRSVADARRSADEWLERLGIAERADDSVQSLSSGNQQRVQLALALLDEPELLVLDEPFSGLDPIAVEMLSEVLRAEAARGAALLLSSHQLDLVADVCESVVIVDKGRVVLRGDVATLRAASPVRHLDVEFAAVTHWEATGAPAARRHRVTVDVTTDAEHLLADARTCGDVIAYSFGPPDLSEVFRSTIGGEAA